MKAYKGNVRRLTEFIGKVNKKMAELKALVSPDKKAPTAKIKKFVPYIGSLHKKFELIGIIKPLRVIYRFLRSVHNRIVSKHRANAISAPATEMYLSRQINEDLNAPLIVQPAEELKTKIGLKSSVVSKMVAMRLAILRYIKGVLLNPIAKLATALSAAVKYKKKIPHRAKFLTTYAPAAETKSRFNAIKHTGEATAVSAPAQIAGMETFFTAAHTAKASTAAAIFVILDSAVKVTHSAPLYAWFLTEHEDENTLYIPQVFSGVQSGTMIEIDLETDATYWANAFNNGGVLHLSFAETAIQTNNNLEVS